MSIKSKVLAAVATLTLVSGVGVAATWTPAQAATPSCGPICPDVFSQQFGTHFTPNYALDVFRQGEKTGRSPSSCRRAAASLLRPTRRRSNPARRRPAALPLRSAAGSVFERRSNGDDPESSPLPAAATQDARPGTRGGVRRGFGAVRPGRGLQRGIRTARRFTRRDARPEIKRPRRWEDLATGLSPAVAERKRKRIAAPPPEGSSAAIL